MSEIWKPVVGYETKYEVSSAGRVRVAATGAMRRPQRINKGYLVLKLAAPDGARQRTRTIHSLVAEAFLGPRQSGQQVNHKDGDKQNNLLDNLEWVTPKQNVAHAIKAGLMRGPGNPNPDFCGPPTPQVGSQNYNARLSEHQVKDIILSLAQGDTGPSLALRFGVSTSLIHAIRTKRRWSHVTL